MRNGRIVFFNIIVLLWALSFNGQSQNKNIHRYFEKIRNNEALLTAFFMQMPKGGDLHHHFSGSVYAETYLEYAIENNYWLNRNTLEVAIEKKSEDPVWTQFSTLQSEGSLNLYRSKLLQKWSVKDYNLSNIPPDKLFFETFAYFSPISKQPNCIAKGLLELKHRAKIENVSYLETMLSTVPCSPPPPGIEKYNFRLRQIQNQRDTLALFSLLDSLLPLLNLERLENCAETYAKNNRRMHDSLQLDESDFIIRYQTYVHRHSEPTALFQSLWIAFAASQKSPLIVGVNIVGAEDHPIALQDYWLHMAMFRYCHKKFPAVKYALHAGELTLGFVKPEELTWHIQEAIFLAQAHRVGHGVDIMHESQIFEILKWMHTQKIPVEINLSSNEFILGVKGNKHPIELYFQHKVPIVICSDDAGVLRNNFTHQFVLLAQRYRKIRYKHIKEFIFNSLHYAFIEEESLKKALIQNLEKRFAYFEKKILQNCYKKL
ncbi:MAG: adenosine deaminase [Bacteroidia bacterium]|nr:adenosine deaminase [Bacteroidia bacterium]MDW8159676.1 adenosine deaminase [Bacteroidia bacterium]